jgi:hypothetical protein
VVEHARAHHASNCSARAFSVAVSVSGSSAIATHMAEASRPNRT